MPSFRIIPVTLLLLLTACSSESFAPRQSRHVVISPAGISHQHQSHRESSDLLSKTRTSTALEQSSVPFPADEFQGPTQRVLQRVRQRLASVSLPRGGSRVLQAPATSTQKEGSFLKRHPFLSAISITTVNAVVADLMTQLVFQKSIAGWNAQRTLVFGVFGLLYQGMVQYFIVNGVWEKVFPGTSKRAVFSKICAMNLLSDPLFFMPTFYIFQQAMTTGMAGASLTSSITTIVSTALSSYKANCLIDWRNSWMVWFPGHAVTYGVMPSHKRIPWMAFLSFFYMCILSITRGSVGV